jgi:hypothetical protein
VFWVPWVAVGAWLGSARWRARQANSMGEERAAQQGDLSANDL